MEWLVANGLGGYASGPVAGPPTRRFHGALIAATERGRMLACSELQDDLSGDFSLELGLPVWRSALFEKRLVMPHGRNLAIWSWRALQPFSLSVRPWFQIRPHEGRVDAPARAYRAAFDGGVCEIDRGSSLPVLLIASRGSWTARSEVRRVRYVIEEERGYDFDGPLVNPSQLSVQLAAGEEVTLAVTTDAWVPSLDLRRLRSEELQRRAALGSDLAIAADAFVVTKPSGEPSVIAGYHWFTDWGRDTMISLEGLCLTTRRFQTARRILSMFASHARDGLIPNLFPEGESQGLYHTADAALWFFHAIDRYTQLSGDATLLQQLLPLLREIVTRHLLGTRFGIGVDSADGLLVQGAPGYQLTWMDAKVGDWVVTPRSGKAVEINALFYNALRLLDSWTGDKLARAAAERLRTSFNARFFNAGLGHLYDVIDPDDASLRPNQLLAISLPHPVLERQYWEPVLRAVRAELLTPFGLRSLGPREPGYKPRYFGDLRTRDAAYHQGTVWAWLMGPFVDAWHKAFPGDDVSEFVSAFPDGFIAEIFDAEAPHTPRGCIAQAWSVAEVLRLKAAM